jgi:hypothetical protein
MTTNKSHTHKKRKDLDIEYEGLGSEAKTWLNDVPTTEGEGMYPDQENNIWSPLSH